MLDKSAPALSESTKSRKAVGRRAPSKKQPRCPCLFRFCSGCPYSFSIGVQTWLPRSKRKEEDGDRRGWPTRTEESDTRTRWPSTYSIYSCHISSFHHSKHYRTVALNKFQILGRVYCNKTCGAWSSGYHINYSVALQLQPIKLPRQLVSEIQHPILG